MSVLSTHLRSFPIGRQERLYAVLIGLWILSMISVPILRWIFGDGILPLSVTMTVIAQVAAVLSLLGTAWGWRRTLLTLGGVAALGWLVEFIGSRTGFPFGAYSYTASLQPQMLGVPLLIPLAWFMMLPPAWAVAQNLVGLRRRTVFIVCSAAAFTAWDLFLDPQMVAWGFWAWVNPVGYFGIPWVNFLGWLLCSALITACVRPRALPTRPLLLIYAITWVFQTIGLAIFWGQPGPAAVGFVVMGAFLGLAVRAQMRSSA